MRRLAALFLLTACAPVARADAQYRAYVPVVVGSYLIDSLKGIALSADWACGDMEATGSGWYYAWMEGPPFCDGDTAAEFVPMTHDAVLSIPCPDTLLVYNEQQGAITVQQGADGLRALIEACPNTYMVFGNVQQTNLAWTTDALADYESKHGPYLGAIGVHAYCDQTADGCLQVFADAAALGYPLWITETAVFHSYDTPSEVTRLLDGCMAVATRCAYYTNRVTTGDLWYDREFYLFNNGILTPAGEAYRDW